MVVVSSPFRPRTRPLQHRVLIYCTCYNVLDGVTLTIRKLEQEILAANHHVCILTTKSGDAANTNLDGTHPNRQVIFLDNAIPIPFLEDSERPEMEYQLGFSLSAAVKQEIEDFEPSIIHITVTDCTALHLIEYARKKELPIMGTYHSNIPEYMEHYGGLSWLKHILAAFFRHQYNFFQALYVPTPYIQRRLTDNYAMDRVTSLKVWGRGVDVDKFNPAYRSMQYRRDFLGIADDTTVIVWVGRIVPEKRPDIFANVVRRLHSRGVNFHALIVGAGPFEEKMKALPNATFVGWINAEQLSTAYASSDVFLFPSAVETFGNVTLEAAASGLSLVVESGCSGHLVQDGENGFTCDDGDEDGFFEATLSLVEDKQMREEFGANSRELALTMEKHAVVRKMIQNYSKVTDEFYTEYSGRHANRDSVYNKPGSFNGGMFPRPLILIFSEYLFILVFKLLYKMLEAYAFLKDLCLRRSSSTRAVTSVAVPPLPSSVPLRYLKEKQASIDFSLTKKMSFVELPDLEFGTWNKVRTSNTDDTTATTTSNSSQDSSAAAPSRKKSFGDCRISHVLAKLFVSTVQLLSRMETHVRQTASSCFSSGITFVGMTKRKNSITSLCDVTMEGLSGKRRRSRSDFSDTVTRIDVPCSRLNESCSPSSKVSCGLQNCMIRRTKSAVIEAN